MLAGNAYSQQAASDELPTFNPPRSVERLAELALPLADKANGQRRTRGDAKSIAPALADPPSDAVAIETPAAAVQLAPDAKVELIQERYPSGAVKIAREMAQDDEGNFINHGSWKMWDERGRVKLEGSYELNQPHGEWVQIHYEDAPHFMQQAPYRQFTAPITSRANFERGRLHGDWTVIDGKQLKVCEIRFADGQRDGRAVWYAANARPRREVQYREGLIHGELVEHGPNGEAITREQYEEGRRMAPKITYHKGDKKKTSGMYLHARLVVQQPDDWWRGVMATYTTQGKDERHGPWTSWHANGLVEQKGEFRHDVPVGKFSWWHANGQSALSGEYLAGKQHGDWTWWHENGLQATIGHYENGVPVGQWMWWKNDGKVAQKVDYADGVGEIVTIKTPEEQKSSAAPSSNTPKTGQAGQKSAAPSALRTTRQGASR